MNVSMAILSAAPVGLRIMKSIATCRAQVLTIALLSTACCDASRVEWSRIGNDSSKFCVGDAAGGKAVGGGESPIVFVVASEWLGGVESFGGRVQDITIDDCLDFSWSDEMVASLQGPVIRRWRIEDLARYAAVEHDFDAVLVRPIGGAIAMDVEANRLYLVFMYGHRVR